jgi:DNA-binding transcriptional LysR family regulator
MEQNQLSADDCLLFVAIAEQGSLVGAAEYLAMPKATVSRRLAGLEATLGQRLLLRTTRRLALTDFGRDFLDHCRRVAEEVALTQDFVRSQALQPRGPLRVSMPEDYARQRLACAIATFIDAWPEVQLDLDLTARRVDLIGERFDLAIRMGQLTDDSALVARKIDEQRMGLYASPIYLALRPVPQHPDELLRHTAVRMVSASGAPVPWRLARGKENWEGVMPGRLNVNAPSTIQQLLLGGAGIGLLPELTAADEVGKQRLVRILPEWQLPVVPVWAVMPMRRYLPLKTSAFLTHIESYLSAA